MTEEITTKVVNVMIVFIILFACILARRIIRSEREGRIKITELGWMIGHFILPYRLEFRRNTLIEYRNIKIVVSTVGAMFSSGKIDMIVNNIYYTTMAFHSDENDKRYHDIDVEREVFLDCKIEINHYDEDTDNEANEMHDNAVEWICKQLRKKVEL